MEKNARFDGYEMPHIVLVEYGKMTGDALVATYEKVLNDLKAEETLFEFTEKVKEYIDGKIAEVKDRTFKDLMEGRITINSPEDMERLPFYEEEAEDGTCVVKNIPANIEWWLCFLAYLIY